MHELSVTQSVVDAIVERMGDAEVAAVCLEIGKLSGVVPDSVRFCFEVVCAGTTLEGARLDILEPGGQARCRDCDGEFALPDLIPLCPCGSANVEITAGRQLRIRSVEVA
ncbi:hydrogenase maturation nickel metallochaperone HypA [Amycolatopsis acidiphila]|uniref:Hydrogenase maturation factor HypA n=1 Tax=Amycolatopsis acidiphila TaxID=715473 RepID=A0A558AG80_9PSEU|nr:hydrogenase maturation nickel metallochaperone HypA [Amycolatopsis acidiphila]TVT23269.1 hydrogenase maturation nickel metallochaperone HypA [Amycolatopsis acidiphila]UIJ56488.1 hydrogenase maturation nickel metallochaperone HypA [Amycolatopsis acidiphila]GHG66987.1 hydrogenase nickel incorporation protein HypA [Amycolatopsis acidiphila]